MLSIPIGTQLRALALAAATLFAAWSAGCCDASAQDSISLTLASLTNGAPCLITVALHDEASTIAGQWQSAEGSAEARSLR